MSSRAFRKLHGTEDLDLNVDGLDLSDEENAVNNHRQSKKYKKSNANKNPFDLLNEGSDEANVSEEEPTSLTNGSEEKISESLSKPNTNQSKKKKKKKKKKDNKLKDEVVEEEVEDEVEASVREVNRLLGELPSGPVDASSGGNVPGWERLQPLLTVEHKNLNPTTEMRRKFGSHVVAAEARTRRNHRRVHHRTSWLVQPKDTWPAMSKTGLSMELVSTRSGVSYFNITHSTGYQQVQVTFWEAVDSLNPQNIVNVLGAMPHHIDSLLQLAEVCRMSEDSQTAADLIERALYCFECNFHTLFNVTQGNCRLDYRRPENRAFYMTVFRHLIFIGNKGCYRTALEFCKLLLSMDPDGDPLGVLLMIDFYSLRCEEYAYLIRLYHDWQVDRNLTQLPNFAFSIPLAMFLQARQEGQQDISRADDMLQEALLMFPSLLIPLLDKCGINPDSSVTKHAFFSQADVRQSSALRQLIALYVGRCHSCWKEPEVVYWLESNVKTTLTRVDKSAELIKQNEEKCNVRYQGMPRNIHRHIVISEVQDATASLPPELANTPVMSYDPLPPTDSIASYTRPSRRRVIDDTNASSLSLFFRSLMPNFNPQEAAAVEQAIGAAGGDAAGAGNPTADIRAGVNTLMEAMRDLLNNIQPVPPPVENGENEQADVDHGEEPAPGDWD